MGPAGCENAKNKIIMYMSGHEDDCGPLFQHNVYREPRTRLYDVKGKDPAQRARHQAPSLATELVFVIDVQEDGDKEGKSRNNGKRPPI